MSDETKDTPEQAEFRAHCQKWLAENHPGQPPVHIPQGALELSDPDAMEWLQQWQKSAYDAGLVGCDYAKASGGGGMTDCQSIANQEMQRAKTPFLPNIIGMGMAAPTIYFHAREEVKEELLPRLLSGEDIWCQGFSEPGAGSDLANQQTFAEKKGDSWVINGHKVWTSLAHFASWMILLCRTSKDDKYNGLSYFVVPIESVMGKGVTVRPLIKMTGETGFNEVIFEDLVVEDKYRLDEVGAGWKVAMTTLAHERGAGLLVTPSAGGMVTAEEKGAAVGSASSLIDLARQSYRNGKTAADDAVIRDAVMKLIIRQEGFRQNQRRIGVKALNDHPMRLPLQFKLVATEIGQDIAQLAYEIEGAGSSLYVNDDNAPAGGQWQLAYMNSFGITIAAGANEVQRNILGERVLNMPKSK
ncbi:MAG: acyl-CoA dehydrogenase family protein [bacterium]|nr:acyl-CoA dehydrogenase [Gammaproteobacteria bacterium]HIL95668.1 acyl-CoA dehydrogenase [Pseudomonadales bacterium]